MRKGTSIFSGLTFAVFLCTIKIIEQMFGYKTPELIFIVPNPVALPPNDIGGTGGGKEKRKHSRKKK
jgi:hypothetical protein